MKKIIAVLVWAAVLSGLVFYLVSHAEEIGGLLDLSVADVTLLGFLFLCTQLINGLRTTVLLRKVGVSLNILECFNLANINTAVNYLPLKGGMFAMAFYFKNKYQLSYTNFANITIASNLVQLSAVTFTAALFIVIYCLATGFFLAKLFYIFTLLFIGALLVILLLKRLVKDMADITTGWERAKKAASGLNIILSDRAFLLKLLGINFLGLLIIGARFTVSFKLLSFNGPLILSLLSGGAKIIATQLSLIPSGLGIAELFAGGVSGMMNSGVDIGVYAASVDRVVSVLVLIFISSLSFVYLYRHKSFDSRPPSPPEGK